MPDKSRTKRREILAGLSTVSFLGIAGCMGGNDSNEDSSGSINENSTDTPTESGYDPQEYYGLPECDGSRSIRLISVNSDGSGIIQNMTSEAKLVSVRHDDDGFSDGDYCGDVIVNGGEQTAYEVSAFGEPNRIRIGAVDDNSRNRDETCNQGGLYIDEYNHGCVDPNIFQGFREINYTPRDDSGSDVSEDALEAQIEDTETPNGTPEKPVSFSQVTAELQNAHAPEGIAPKVVWEGYISNNRDDAIEMSYSFIVESSTGKETKDRSRDLGPQETGTIYRIPLQLESWLDDSNADTRDERSEVFRTRFNNASVYIEYNGEQYQAEKSIDEYSSYP